MEENTALIEINRAQQALERANDIHEIIDLRDKAMAFQLLANARGFKEAAQEAKIYQLKAERKAGEWLAVNVTHEGNRFGMELQLATPLPDGVDKYESHRWQVEAIVPEEQFNEWIDESLSTGKEISAAGLMRIGYEIKRKAEIPTNKSDFPPGKYHVIYADPPWRYDFAVSPTREIENQYPTMELEEICALPVKDLGTPDSVLFLWATNPKLLEAIKVIEDWGYNYRTNMVWIKDKIGMGYYARQRHELLLIATRGELPVPEPANRPDSVIISPRTEHSKKPERVYEIIETMYPEYRKIELFARNERTGWDVWGNQV